MPKKRIEGRKAPKQMSLFRDTDVNTRKTNDDWGHNLEDFILIPIDSKYDYRQASLFPELEPIKDKENLDGIVISHGKNFRIEGPFLKSLSEYNDYLKRTWDKDLEYDNLFLRKMYNGIKNAINFPPKILDGLNAMEVCLIYVGILKRKYVSFDDMVIKQGKNIHSESRKLRRDPALHSLRSRIKEEFDLDNKSLYETVDFLLNASELPRILKKYIQDWENISKLGKPSRKQKRFMRLNPYDPATLPQRMDYMGRNYPDKEKEFKQGLEQPFIPARRVRIDEHGNVKQILQEGHDVPLKTYRKGVRGKSFQNIREFIKRVYTHFQNKEAYYMGQIKKQPV